MIFDMLYRAAYIEGLDCQGWGKPVGTTAPQLPEQEEYDEIVNVSGATWVMDISTDPAYFDDLDGIDASDFAVAPDESLQFMFDAGNESYGDTLDALTELSPTTYTITLTCAAGPKPEDKDEEYVYLNPAFGQTAFIYYITINGTYGKYAVVEWDGAAFTQVK